MDSIKNRFSSFLNNGYFTRVDPEHPLKLFIGLDESGKKSIKLRAKFIPKPIKGTTALEVSQFKAEEYNTIQFSLCDEDISGLFYKFCEDFIESSRSVDNESDGYLTITNRFFQWKKMFLNPKNEFLTEPEVMGLIGEIMFLDTYLFNQYEKHEALKGWSGQELTHKDFSYQNIWYEVKTINRSNQTVKISSIEQLDSDKVGELVVYCLEKMSPAFDGITLNSLVSKVYNDFESEDDKGKFLSKVAMQGFAYNDYYDEFVFEVYSKIRFEVREGFPKLTREFLPCAILKAKYDLALVEIKEYEIND